MITLSHTIFSWVKCILRATLIMAFVLSQGAAGVVTAQDDGPELVRLRSEQNPIPARSYAAETEITTADSASRGVVDTFVDYYPDNAADNWGFESILVAGYAGGKAQRALIEPSLAKIPPKATITSAKLSLALCDGYDIIGAKRTLNFYRVTSPWHQSLATAQRVPTKGEAVGSFTLTVNSNLPAYYEVNLTDLVKKWVNGTYPNYGVMMTGLEQSVQGDYPYLMFCSNDSYYPPTLNITYTTTAPTLGSTPTQMAFAYEPGGDAPEPQTLTLFNNGSYVFSWQAAPDSAWLQVSPPSGEVGPGSSQTIQVLADPTGLSEGMHNGSISLTSATSGVSGFPRSVPVVLGIADIGEIYTMPQVLAGGKTASTSTRDVVTLIIGVADYLYLDEDLAFSSQDANKTKQILRVFGLQHATNQCNCADGKVSLNTPGGLPAATNNILTLTDSKATFENIEAAFAWLDEQETASTTVQIFFSGHGGKIDDLDGDETLDGLDEFITAYDTYTSGYDYFNIITDDQLNDWLSELESSKVAVVIDACFSGGLIGPEAVEEGKFTPRGLPYLGSADGAMPPVDPGIDLASDLEASGREVITASTVDQVSWETVQLQQGVLTYYIMMALLNPNTDTNRDQVVSMQEAFVYARTQMNNYFGDSTTQTPQLSDGVLSGSVGLSWSTASTTPCK